MSRWIAIAVSIVAIFGAVFGLRSLIGAMNDQRSSPAAMPTLEKPVPNERGPKDGMKVVVLRSTGETRPMFLSLSGRTEAARRVVVKSETSGTVTAGPAKEGRTVSRGELLCVLDVQSRAAKLREAESAAKARQLDYDHAAELAAKGWAAESRVAVTRAALDTANAALEVAKLDFAKTQIRAPFSGLFEKRSADVGEFLSPGAPCGSVVELDPVLVIASATEQEAARIRPDAPARLRLSDGAEAKGKVRLVSKAADADTRAFRVEIEVANPSGAIAIGRTAEVRIEVGQGDAHKIAPQLLTLDGDRHIGVRFLDVGGVVTFAAADMADETSDGVWVSGLPHEALIVAEGQDEVKPGVRATPVFRAKKDAT